MAQDAPLTLSMLRTELRTALEPVNQRLTAIEDRLAAIESSLVTVLSSLAAVQSVVEGIPTSRTVTE